MKRSRRNHSAKFKARVALEALRGDATLFDRGDNVEAAWSLVDPILDVWTAAKSASVSEYAAGTWGPRESDHMLQRDGNAWREP